jgi:hypothetical protein
MSATFHEGDFELILHAPAEKLDAPGKRRPQGMQVVDFVIEEAQRILLLEIKDPSSSRAPAETRPSQLADFARRMKDDTLIAHDLVPKARDSYCFLHLMCRDAKPMLYVVVLGLAAYEPERALLLGFKDRLLRRLRHEADEPWKRAYVQDCVVLTESRWATAFPEHALRRMSDPGRRPSANAGTTDGP